MEIDEDGWICPRKKIIRTKVNMSGTPFKYIDFNSLNIFHMEV